MRDNQKPVGEILDEPQLLRYLGLSRARFRMMDRIEAVPPSRLIEGQRAWQTNQVDAWLVRPTSFTIAPSESATTPNPDTHPDFDSVARMVPAGRRYRREAVCRPFRARVKMAGREIHLGYFETSEQVRLACRQYRAEHSRGPSG